MVSAWVCLVEMLMQIAINGLVAGSAISLLAVAFQIVYLPTRVFFVGLAGLYCLAPYLWLLMQANGMHWIICVLTSVCVASLLAVLCEWVNHAPLERKGASEGSHLISSLGIYILFVQLVIMVWGNDAQTLRKGLDATVHLGGMVLTRSQVLLAAVSWLMMAGFVAMLRVTDIGLRLRALADNPVQFALFGYNVDVHRLIAFGLAGVFGAAASLLTAYDIGFNPHRGLHAVLLAVVAVIVGGRSSFMGPIIGGIVLGVIRAQVVWHLSARWQEAATFAVLGLFLLLKPQGLFGHRVRIEAAA